MAKMKNSVVDMLSMKVASIQTEIDKHNGDIKNIRADRDEKYNVASQIIQDRQNTVSQLQQHLKEAQDALTLVEASLPDEPVTPADAPAPPIK